MARRGDRADATGLRRVLALSDGVYAIGMTLLAISIELPALPADPTDGELAAALLQAAPSYVGYVVSFIVAGIFWIGHHRYFRHIERYDAGLLWLNLFLLMSVAFLPYPSRLIGRYPMREPIVILYAAAIVAIGVFHAALWLYASHDRRLIDPGLAQAKIRYNTLRGLIVPATFLLSIGVALVSTLAAMAMWFLIAVPLILLAVLHPGAGGA